MKKLLGIVLIGIGAIIALGILTTVPDTIREIVITLRDNRVDQWGFLLGGLFATFIMAVATFFLFMFGFKLMKNKQKITQTSEEQ